MAVSIADGTDAVMTPARDIKLLLTDVDGTLVTHDKVLTPAARGAAADLRQSGVQLALTSARPPRGMRMLIEPLRLDLPLAGFNGGLITDTRLKALESHPIAPVAGEAAIELLKGAGLDIWIYTDADWFVSATDGPHVARESWITKIDPMPMPTAADRQLGRVFKIVGVSDDHPKLAAAGVATHRRLDGVASVSQSEAAFLDITDVEANKGFVVHSLARRLGLTAAQIATIGDMPNDILMFRESGYSIAMGNASDEVKSNADAVTDSNEDEGFAKAVDRFLLAANAFAGEDRGAP